MMSAPPVAALASMNEKKPRNIAWLTNSPIHSAMSAWRLKAARISAQASWMAASAANVPSAALCRLLAQAPVLLLNCVRMASTA